ncbi:MAG TPA: META domain-containing protein [Candidatus Binatia bacterium]|nr:META domain-containing protein [Candidatus Binatia bacterium]
MLPARVVSTLLGAFGSFGLAFVTEAYPSEPTKAAMQAPTLKEIKNASYSGIEGLKGSVKLVDGKWKGRPYKKGSASRPVVSLIGDFRITGDLDGDGTDDAVVLLNYAPGGTGQLLHLALMARKKGKIQNLATALIGDRVQIRDVRIEQKRIFVDVIQAGPKDAMCCPGEVTTREWTLEPGGKLNRYTVTAKPARLTLETIGNTEWILRSWDSKQPAPTRPAVTLVFKDGRFTGSSGCNNYFAPAKDGKIPGDVEVGAVGTTRKSCPDNEMSVERRFLEQLVRVRKFGFLVTQLALSWEKDGVWKTMLFDKRQPRLTDK